MTASIRRRFGSEVERQIARTTMAMESAPDVATKLLLRENLIRLQAICAKTRQDNAIAAIQEGQIAMESQMPFGVYAHSYEETEELAMLARRSRMANDEVDGPWGLGEWLDPQEQD